MGTGEIDKKKHDIKHEKGGKTTVTDVVVGKSPLCICPKTKLINHCIPVPLSSPVQVQALLQRAHKRRTVAATLMNERSSRSHSVFTLRVTGHNTHTGESCSGSLNLVDLAGSERLNSSGAANDKDRLKETQAINKSLSALGDVIAALGNSGAGGEKGHIPYRNSKLTYLLQNSLSGNSKTLVCLTWFCKVLYSDDISGADDDEYVPACGPPWRVPVFAEICDQGMAHCMRVGATVWLTIRHR